MTRYFDLGKTYPVVADWWAMAGFVVTHGWTTWVDLKLLDSKDTMTNLKLLPSPLPDLCRRSRFK
ncbi:hypothetical protein ACLOJK_029374 [Asimina triloba]